MLGGGGRAPTPCQARGLVQLGLRRIPVQLSYVEFDFDYRANVPQHAGADRDSQGSGYEGFGLPSPILNLDLLKPRGRAEILES